MMFSKNIENIIKENNINKIFIGFSGGIDSTALLIYCQNLNIDIEAIHFNHNLRKESQCDADWCKDFCEVRNIKFQSINLKLKGSEKGIEAEARELRLKHWFNIAKSANSAVALGHHYNDRIENLFLRLSRGSNISGLTSMRTFQKINKVNFIRPFLSNLKDELKEYLKDNSITEWREDNSNSDNKYMRNFFRNDILPAVYAKLDYAEKGIYQSIQNLDIDADFIEQNAKNEFELKFNKESIEINKLNNLHQSIKFRVLNLWLSKYYKYDFLLNKRLINRIDEEINKNIKVKIAVNKYDFLLLNQGQLSILKENKSENKTIIWDWQKNKKILFGSQEFSIEKIESIDNLKKDCVAFDADKLSKEIIIRDFQNGDKMIPFGKNSEVKLKKIFVDAKIISENRKEYPILISGNNIIWISGLKRANFANITDTIKNIIMIQNR